jgi:glycosyltransferase involved in cell wall biosynthesis
MQILHVIGTLNPSWGGPVEGVRNITKQAMLRGHNVHIVTVDHPDSPWLSGWAPTIHAVGHIKPAANKYRFSRKLDEWLDANLPGFDRVVVHSIWMYFSFAVWKATRKTGTPYFLFIHGALDPWFKKQYPLKHIKKVLYWKLFEHKVLRDASAVLFTTQEEMLLAKNAFLPYQCRPAVIGYGIAPPVARAYFDQDSFLSRLTESHSVLKRRKFLLFLSRIHEKKGLDLLLSAFAACRDLLPDTALVVAGLGDEKYTASLKNLATSLNLKNDVIWVGPLYGDAKLDTIRAAEAYVLPSHQENFGIGVVEALACGTPVLVSDKVNIWREVKQANAGFVHSDDELGTCRLLTQWANAAPRDRAEMRIQAKACFSENFDMNKACERLFEVILADQPDSNALTTFATTTN